MACSFPCHILCLASANMISSYRLFFSIEFYWLFCNLLRGKSLGMLNVSGCPMSRAGSIAVGGGMEGMCIKPAGRDGGRFAEWIWSGSLRAVDCRHRMGSAVGVEEWNGCGIQDNGTWGFMSKCRNNQTLLVLQLLTIQIPWDTPVLILQLCPEAARKSNRSALHPVVSDEPASQN